MDFKTFLENFDAIAEAPGGIQKLRSLILDLAVRGKLVPQNPEDEPSENNLLAMKIYRANWLKEQSDSNQEYRRMLKKLSALASPEPAFEIPKNWVCAYLIDLSLLIVDCHNKTAPTQLSGIPLIRTTNVRHGKFRLRDLKFVSEETYQFWSRRCFPEPGDIIFTREAPMGEAAIIPEGMKVCLGQRTMLIRVLEEFVDRDFLLLTLIEPGLLTRISGSAVGMTVKHLRVEDVEQIVIAVPPLAEQKRIVEKVDELMVLCDRLQQYQETRDNLRQKLRASAIDSLMNAETDEELKQSWAIVRDNWQTLSQKPEDVSDLRRSVLQLAVRGKLVSQNSNAEPASVLLAEITKEQKQLIEKRKVRKPENLPPIQLDDMPFLLPQEWIWVYVQDVGEVKLGRQRSPQNHNGPYMVPYLRVANVLENKLNLSDVKSMNFSPEEQVTFRLKYGDILLNEGQSYELVGRPALYRDEVPGACFQNTLLRFRVYGELLAEYALIVFRAYLHNGRFRKEAQQTTNIAHLSANRLSKIEFPLPPKDEQKQIVTKVDRLMQMCDQLEESLRQSRQWAEALAASAISHLTI